MVEVALFDMGGVLVELDGAPVLGRWASLSEDEVWRRWLGCPWVRRFERGQCSADEFADGLIEEWSLPIGPRELLDQFLDWPGGLMAGAEGLVREVQERARIALLSNTNALHWASQRDADRIHELFELAFVSHEMGHVKPDAAAFEHVVRELGCAPEAILFLDDNQINVDGARAVGLRAELVRGVDQARRALRTAGLLGS